MPLPEAIGFVVLAAGWGAQFTLRPLFIRYRRAFFTVGAAAIAAAIVVLIRVQYLQWAADPLSQFLLPPHRGWAYFAGYMFSRVVAPWCIAAVAAAIAWFAARALNRRFGGRFFEDEESTWFAMGVFFAGYPGFFFYLTVMFSAGTLVTAAYAAAGKGRAPLRALWFPMALLAILIVQFVIPQELIVRFNL